MYTKFSKKTNISYPLIRTRTCAYQGLRNVIFPENFANVSDDPRKLLFVILSKFAAVSQIT